MKSLRKIRLLFRAQTLIKYNIPGRAATARNLTALKNIANAFVRAGNVVNPVIALDVQIHSRKLLRRRRKEEVSWPRRS